MLTENILIMEQKGTALELGTEKVGKLLTKYAVPAIIAMTASSLYHMVDSIFIGQGVGAMAISGLAVTFPLMNLAAAFGSLVGVGGGTLISVKLGQKDYVTAQKIFGNVISLNLLIGISFMVIALALLDPILLFFGASEATLPYARDYMLIILLGNPITHMFLGLNSVLRSAGYPRKAMNATIFTVVINTILDPLFIYTLDLGIQGAAYATILSQTLSLVWQIWVFSRKDELLHFQRGIYSLKKKLWEGILSIGMAPFLMNIASCFVVILINKGLKLYDGDLAIGAFGISNRIVFLFVMVVIGFNQGMQPIAGYNFGAQRYDRVNDVLRQTITAATIVTTTGFLVGMFLPRLCVSAFTTDAELIRLAARGFRISVLAFPIVGFQMVASNFFQSIGKANKAIVLSLCRQVLVLIPCLLILPLFLGGDGIWFSMPVADFVAAVIAGVMLAEQFRSFKSHKRQTVNGKQ